MNLNKIQVIVCSVMATVALSACSDSKSSETKSSETSASAPAASAATKTNQAQSGQDLVIGTEANFFPLRYRDGENPKPSGFQIEVLDAAAKAANVNIRYTYTNSASNLDKLANADYNATLATFDATPENQARADFTKSITTTKFVIHMKSDNMGTGSTADLQGKTISIDKYYAANPATMELLEKLTGSRKNIVVEGYLFSAWKSMITGKTDGVFGEDLVLDHTYHNNKDKISVKIKTIDLNLPANERALLLRKGSDDLLSKLNTGIDKIKADGTYDALKAKWFPALQ